MARTISIGAQSFADMRESGVFLVDKTALLRDWWESRDAVTLICRPRRFGKTLNMSMVECFLSQRYAGRSDLFEGLEVWEDEHMRVEQGAWPVVSLSFASVKAPTFERMRDSISLLVANVYRDVLGDAGALDPMDASIARAIIERRAGDTDLAFSLNQLCRMLHRMTGKRVVVLLDEYDTPLQEAWVDGYWDQARDFIREFFNATFKTNPLLERGLLTGVTRVAHESIFSDLNNLKVVTSESDEYAADFGFTQDEVDGALVEFGLASARDDVRSWYDGFTFGGLSDMYNPWSITNFLDTGKLAPYWANTSGNALVSSLLLGSDEDFKSDFELLLQGQTVRESVSDQVVFADLERDPSVVWALLVAGGYLASVPAGEPGAGECDLKVTNHETMLAFDSMVRRWFAPARVPYNRFVRALLAGDVDEMNAYMNEVALETFSAFDTGRRPSRGEPERFYHGFVLGLLVDLRGRYRIRSNRESGFGRYDVMLEPMGPRDDAILLEFKVRDPRREDTLEATVEAALTQIRDKNYAADLVASGVVPARIRAYGLAFEGKHVLIG